MGTVSGIVVYVILWWLVFFMTLPIGVRAPHEVGQQVEPGHEGGAPIRHHLLWKVLAATVIAAMLWSVAYWVIDAGIITFRGG